jgi:predicted nucleotidyltransferase
MSEVRIVIDTSLKARLAAIFQGRKVAFAYLFGSQAKGEVGPLSDIDIAVGFDESVASDQRFDLRLEVLGELTDLFKSDDIDLVVLNDAPPLLAHRVLKEGLLLFSADEKARLEFETRAVLKYLDWKPYLEKYTRQVLGSGAEHDR